MKNQFDFKDMMAFGLFLLALLTFVFTFCEQSYIEESHPKNFGQVMGGIFLKLTGSTTLWAVVLFLKYSIVFVHFRL